MTKRKPEDVAKRDIEYHYKALKSCRDDFPYRKDIKSSLAEEHAQRGHGLYDETNYDGAIEEYYRAREQNPEHYPAIHQLGMSLHKQYKFEQARIYFQEIISRIHHAQRVSGVKYTEDFKDEFEARLSIAYTHIEENIKGSLPKAKKIILSAQELAPSYQLSLSKQQEQLMHNAEQKLINSLLKSIYACLSRKNWVEAGKVMNEAMQFAPTHPRVLAAEQKLRDSVSTNAYTSFKQTLFSNTSVSRPNNTDIINLNTEETNQSAICVSS